MKTNTTEEGRAAFGDDFVRYDDLVARLHRVSRLTPRRASDCARSRAPSRNVCIR